MVMVFVSFKTLVSLFSRSGVSAISLATRFSLVIFLGGDIESCNGGELGGDGGGEEGGENEGGNGGIILGGGGGASCCSKSSLCFVFRYIKYLFETFMYRSSCCVDCLRGDSSIEGFVGSEVFLFFLNLFSFTDRGLLPAFS